MDNPTYFEKLVGSVTRIARHSYYPGKEHAVDLCLEDIEGLSHSGLITVEQANMLRAILLGAEPFSVRQTTFREHDPMEDGSEKVRIAFACQGDGSHTAFTAGVLQGLLEREDDDQQIVALSGTSGGAICALLAWDGLLRGDRRRAVDQLQRFWHENTASTLLDALLNYSIQMASRMRALVAIPEISPYSYPSWDREQLRRMLERRVDFAQARALAGREGAPGLLVGAVDVRNGAFEVFQGTQISADCLLASAALPHLFPAITLDDHFYGDGLFPSNPPIWELTDFQPDEIWVIQNTKATGKRLPRTVVDFSDRRNELFGDLALAQELRFLRKINEWLEQGVLIDSGYRHIEVRRIVLERDLDFASKLDRSPGFIQSLMAEGRAQAKHFLDERRRASALQVHS